MAAIAGTVSRGLRRGRVCNVADISKDTGQYASKNT